MYGIGLDIGIDDPCGVVTARFEGMQPVPLQVWSITSDTKLSWDRRIAALKCSLRSALIAHGPDLVVWAAAHAQYFKTKDGGRMPNIQTVRKLAAIEGALIGLCDDLSIPWVIVQESQSKVAMCGNDRASKDDVLRTAQMLYGLPAGTTEHEADALAHLLAGEALCRQQQIQAQAPKAPRRKRVTA